MAGRSGKVFVVISLQGVSDEIREAIDQGAFDRAKDLSYRCKSVGEKVQSLVQERGGHIHVFLADRQVLEVPTSMAEDVPMILEGYSKDIPGLIAVGMGLSFREAVAAMHASIATGDIEMYDPENPIFEGVGEYIRKVEQPLELPVNMFDATIPKVEGEDPDQDGFVAKPEFEKDVEMQSAMVQAMAQVLQGGQQQQQQMMQQAQQQPRDLREALEGKQVDGYAPAEEGEEGKGKKSKDSEGSGEKSETKGDDEGDEGDSDKLDALLGKVKESLPQIMALHDKNPQAYKAAMALVQKLVQVAKQGKTKKAEEVTDELEKAIRLRLPVGARKGNKRKVLVDGKEVWRSMAAGQVQDSKGQPISVRESNKEAGKTGAAGGK